MKKSINLMTVLSLKLHWLIVPLIILGTTPSAHGQSQKRIVTTDDTISAGEVLIIPEVPDGAGGFKAVSLDLDLLNAFPGNSLSLVLGSGSPVYIKSYGAGGLSTSSFRGMGASHTQVVWEGLRVDNPMTGQTDLFTFHAGFVDNIYLYSGGSPSGFANRGSGGTISLESPNDWSEGTEAKYTQNIGSFSSFSESISFKTGSSAIQYSLKANLQNAKNDYGYYDSVNGSSDEVLLRSNSSFLSRGMLNELFFKSLNTVYSAKLWYSLSDRNLPGSIAFPAPDDNEHQLDESLRSILTFTNYRPAGEIAGTVGYVSDWLEYTNIQYGTYSRNLHNTLSGNLSGKFNYSESTSISFGIEGSHTSINTNNYESIITRDRFSLEAIWSKVLLERIGVFASANQEFVDGEFLNLSPSLGLDISLFENRDYHIKGSFGRSNHLPTLNDLYWFPGGNPDLETETAENIEATFSLNDKIFKVMHISTSITGFNSSIDNMISWQPVSATIWSPINILKVRSRGIEIDQVIRYSTDSQGIKLFASYRYTDVRQLKSIGDNDNSVGKQLIYVPKNMASISLIYKYRNIKASWRSSFTDERYTTSDNTARLPSYWLHDLSVQSRFSIRSSDIEAGLSCTNIFAKDYQNVADYPMPWRSFNLSLSFEFGNR